jgi:two-component system, NarL family, uhpT operon response regulator UhpA
MSAAGGHPEISVAIVDDLQLVVEGLAAGLSRADSSIRVVQSVSSWAALTRDRHFPADVTVLDLRMADGIPIDTKVHALATAGSKVVIISRHTDSASIDRALGSGAFGFVSKNATSAQLAAAIRDAADGRGTPAAPHESALRMPSLGDRERRALMLYAEGLSIKDLAAAMGTTPETVKSYVKRARRKYREAGIDIGTRLLLRRFAVAEGWLHDD